MTENRTTRTTANRTHRTRRRGNNEGSITQLSDGRWQARVTLENGQRKAYYGKTRAEVQQTLTTVLHDRDRGLPITSDRLTLGQYLVGWLDASRHQLKPRSWQRYEEITRRHIAPTLGKLPLTKVTPRTYNDSMLPSLMKSCPLRRSITSIALCAGHWEKPSGRAWSLAMWHAW
jgi:integrase-like protein